MPRALLLLTALAAVLLALPAHATVRPEPLEPKPGCEKWHGQAGGNDPTVELDVQLCPVPKGVTGETQWSSLRSGWSVRAVEGSWSADGQTLALRDVGFNQSKPNPGWRFCLIDHYDLKRVGSDELDGKYRSDACNDSAWVKLKRVATMPASSAAPSTEPGGAASAEPRPEPPAPSNSTHAPPAGDHPPDAGPPSDARPGKGCGACTCALGSTGGRPSPGAWLSPALLLLASARRRRAAARCRPPRPR